MRLNACWLAPLDDLSLSDPNVIEYVLEKHVLVAAGKLPDLKKRSVSPHQLSTAAL
jgi:hypothetical protein